MCKSINFQRSNWFFNVARFASRTTCDAAVCPELKYVNPDRVSEVREPRVSEIREPRVSEGLEPRPRVSEIREPSVSEGLEPRQSV